MIDVCLILEGSYPFVAGGVATWVHQLISSMKDLKFGIVSITAVPDPTRTPKYEIPGHVVYFKEISLHDYREAGAEQAGHFTRRAPRKRDWDTVRSFYEELIHGRYDVFGEFTKLFQGEEACLDAGEFFSSKAVWTGLESFYKRLAPEVSFIDFFWTWRATHLPLINILGAQLPQASIYHAISTGYAGLLGALAKEILGGAFFLTEHGIYTHERMLEISQASWIFEQQRLHYRAQKELPFFKQWWIKIFEVMSRIAYDKADRIFTLYEGNRLRQVAEGADPGKITIIPNGINIREFASTPLDPRKAPQIGLIGRVVGIKDIKTFIQSARRVLNEKPEARFYVVGPVDEEEDYYEECRLLVESMGMEGQITFTGRVDVKEYYSFLDIVVLTSLSEAQPYAILEANVVGIPVVATDVGACREMLEGLSDEDRALGASGLVVEVSNPQATAGAILRLLDDEALYQKMAEAGRLRVTRHYDQDDLLSRYLNVYEQNL